jgi:hypothetical protein
MYKSKTWCMFFIPSVANCDVGYYYDESLEKCQKCTFGTYQDQKYQTSCKSCDTGKTTTTQGNDEESDCIGKGL